MGDIIMKKQDLINLIRYHVEKNDDAFIAEVSDIAKDFDYSGDSETAQYLMEMIADTNVYIPQTNYKNYKYLRKARYSQKPLFLPKLIEEDVIGITKAINKQNGLSKFLFYGKPGTGKTETAYQIARMLNRDLLSVNLEQLVDSKLGETSKNVVMLFDEINHVSYSKTIILFDEIDSLVMDRINQNDLREMGRVTSVFLREMDSLNENVKIIATTNLMDSLDKALVRRFDALISFNRYSKEDLIEIADSILISNLKHTPNTKQDLRLFHKILNNLDTVPYPGDLKQIIKTSLAFCDDSSEYDYLRKIYLALNHNPETIDINKLDSQGYTTREIEILSRVPKSSVYRKLRSI